MGMEFKAYQIRTAISESFANLDSNNSLPQPTTSQIPTKEPEPIIISKSIGDDLVLSTIKLKVNTVEERQSISSSYGSPKVAKEDAKFVVINMDVVNITDSEFRFSPDFILIDNQSRKFSYYDDMIGSIDDYLIRYISPSVKENGNVVYEIPTDADSYGILVAKEGTNEVYKIDLK